MDSCQEGYFAYEEVGFANINGFIRTFILPDEVELEEEAWYEEWRDIGGEG